MKNTIYFYLIILSGIIFFGCQSKEAGNNIIQGGELTIAPLVSDPELVETRVIGNEFFDVGYGIDVTILSNMAGADSVKYTYEYNSDGIFKGNPRGYRFSLDDTYIKTLVAIWPTQEIREKEYVTDQRLLENYRQADWMSATASANGIMPTDSPVPLNFVRQNTMLEFEIAGQNAEGIDIESLVLELDVEGKATAFWAYCGEENGNAYLILKAGIKLESPNNYLIGRLTVKGGSSPYLIIFPYTDLTLEEGKKYLVTLTPSGYDISAYVFIGGWLREEESGIGIPFTPPVPIDNGDFMIETPQHLITMSYLLRHYNEPPLTFDWSDRNYIISDSFEITEELALKYIPVPRSLLNGQIIRDGNPIEQIEYGSGQILELYE